MVTNLDSGCLAPEKYQKGQWDGRMGSARLCTPITVLNKMPGGTSPLCMPCGNAPTGHGCHLAERSSRRGQGKKRPRPQLKTTGSLLRQGSRASSFLLSVISFWGIPVEAVPKVYRPCTVKGLEGHDQSLERDLVFHWELVQFAQDWLDVFSKGGPCKDQHSGILEQLDFPD